MLPKEPDVQGSDTTKMSKVQEDGKQKHLYL